MVAEHTLPRISKMARKKGHIGRLNKQKKPGTKHAEQRAAKAFTSPPGRPSTQEGMQGAEVVLSTPVGLPRGSERRYAAMHTVYMPYMTCHNIGSRTAFYKRIAAIVFSRYMYTSCRVASLKTNN